MSSQARHIQPQPALPQPVRAASNTSRVRCPGCGSLIALPATICPRCQTNLRTGARPEKKFFDESPEVVRKSLILFALKQIKRGLLISLLIAAGILGYLQAKGLDPLGLRPLPPHKPDAFQVIAMQHPAMIKPYIAVLRARASTDHHGNEAAYRAKITEELAKQDIIDFDDGGSLLRTFMSLSPTQRAIMLKEVITIMRGGQLRRAIGLTGQRLGWSWTPMIFPTSGSNKYVLTLLLLIQDPSSRKTRALFITRTE